MNWDAIGAIGETIGSVAVIASLIYLGVQTRTSAKATEGLVRRQIADSSQLAYLTAVDSPEFSSLVLRALTSNADLESAERSQMIRFISSIFLNFEVAYHQYESGLYDEWETVLRRRVRAMFKNSKFAREWWEENKSDQFSESFSTAVDELLSPGAT
jgi:hypothetical protein